MNTLKKEKEAQRKAALKAEKLRKERERGRERPKKTERKFEPPPHKAPRKRDVPHKPKPEAPRPQAEIPVPTEEFSRKKEPRPKKIREEEKTIAKPHKRVERKIDEDSLSAEEIKSLIELEKLKEKMKGRREAAEKAGKEEKVAYKDDGGFAGILASKLDEAVKKDEDKVHKEKDKEKKKP